MTPLGVVIVAFTAITVNSRASKPIENPRKKPLRELEALLMDLGHFMPKNTKKSVFFTNFHCFYDFSVP